MVTTLLLAAVVPSLELSISVKPSPRLHSQPPIIGVSVTNYSKKPRVVWAAGFWPNHRLTILDGKGRSPRPTRMGQSAIARFGSSERDKNAPIEIGPGKTCRYELPPLPDFFRFNPGTYRLNLEYWDQEADPGTHLTSGKISFTIR